jgi:hypothetical protein
MIYDAFLVPEEQPTSLRAIKRALLTYDNVILPDPGDRDLIPRNTLHAIVTGLPIMGIDTGPVRPMGKVRGYDDAFQQTIDACQPAIDQGLLDVRSTYDRGVECSGTLFAVFTGGYPLQPGLVLRLYRGMATNQALLRSAIQRSVKSLLREYRNFPELALKGAGDDQFNASPSLPVLENEDVPQDQVLALTRIARARIAALVKYSGYSEAKELIPVLGSGTYGELVAEVFSNVREVLSDREGPGYWAQANRILSMCHEEFLSEELLDTLTIDKVIKLRTQAWGKQAAAREALFSSVYKLAQDTAGSPDFEERTRALIVDYRKTSEEVVRERRAFAFNVICDFGKAAITLASAHGALTQIQSPLNSPSLTLVAGGIWFLDKAKEYVPLLRAIQAKEAEMKRGAGFGLHNFYSRLP